MQIHDIFDDEDHVEYSLDGLPELARATNVPTVIERIDLAATKATTFMRQHGMTLPGDDDVPTIDNVDYHLRELVNRGVKTYYQMLDSKSTEPALRVLTTVEGVVSDDLFEVTVHPLPKGALHVHISMLLV